MPIIYKTNFLYSIINFTFTSKLITSHIFNIRFHGYWNGAYSGTASNLTYCTKGAFGTAATKNTGDFATASHTHDLSKMINGLSEGWGAPVDADYYIGQQAGGGTSLTTYQRRPISTLWTYIKSKADSTYHPKDSTTFGYCQFISDWNNATTCGFYYGTGADNSPIAGKLFYGMTIAMSSTYIRQSVFQFAATSDLSETSGASRYERVNHNGTWGKWFEIY